MGHANSDLAVFRLRWTSTQEWHDIYQKENLDDLQRFFDHYMKGVQNDWEETPQIRLSLLGYNRPSVVNRVEPSYPPPDFQYKTLYLDSATNSLVSTPALETTSSSYQADAPADDGLHFTLKFNTYTELCGVSKVKLFMSTMEHEDMVGVPDIPSIDRELIWRKGRVRRDSEVGP